MTTGPKAPSDNGRPWRDRTGDSWNDSWRDFPAIFRNPDNPLPAPWSEIFGPLLKGKVDGLMVVAQLGQSIDGRIATSTGHSHYINGPDGLAHLHRLRALVDAVVIGAGTAAADNPQLTVRRVDGPNPARIVIDPRGRVHRGSRMLSDDGSSRLVITSMDASTDLPSDIDVVRLPANEGRLQPPDILAALAARGFHRILIEGGADTISRFLAARCLDRLHVLLAPRIFGSGQASVTLPSIEHVSESIQTAMRAHTLGADVLLDCDLSAQRIPIGVASKST